MADTRISELPSAAPLSGAEQGVAVQSSTTVRYSLQNLPVSIPTQTALDGKAESAHVHAIADVTGLQDELDGKEPAFSKKTAFNKDFGTMAGTAAEGNHTHSNATQSTDGFMSAADKVVVDEVLSPPATNDPVNIGEMTFEFTNDTTLTIKVRGSDNVARSVSLTLA